MKNISYSYGESEVKLLSCLHLLATPWTAAHQTPPSMEFSRQEYRSGVPLPSPKILLARLQHYVDCELSDVQEKVVLEMAEEPEIKLPTFTGLLKKQEFKKTSTSTLLTRPKSLTVWITTNCGKFFKRWEYQTT